MKIENARNEEFLKIQEALKQSFDSDNAAHHWFADEVSVTPSFIRYVLLGKGNFGLKDAFPKLIKFYKANKLGLENIIVWVHPNKVEKAQVVIDGTPAAKPRSKPGPKPSLGKKPASSSAKSGIASVSTMQVSAEVAVTLKMPWGTPQTLEVVSLKCEGGFIQVLAKAPL